MSFLFSGGLFDVIPESGLLHQWSVSSASYPIVDSVGSNDISQQTGGLFLSGPSYYDGAAYQTDGSDDWAQAASHVTAPEFTVVWYLNPQTYDSSGNTFFCNGGRSATSWPAIYTNAYELRAVIRDPSANISSANYSTQISSLTQVAVRYDGTTLSLVVDVVERDTANPGFNQPSSTVAPTIGGAIRSGSPGDYAEADYDLGLFYNRSLSLAELQQIDDAHP